MERVLRLLQAGDHRQALVRLWVLGSDGRLLREWERVQAARTKGLTDAMTQAVERMRHRLDKPGELALAVVQAAPLELMGALDEHVASTQARYNRAATAGRESLVRQENGRDCWLVPVVLQARRLASLNKQVGSLGTWVRRHVVLQTRTAHGLRVVLHVSRSALDESLAGLWLQQSPSLKVWIGHFDDGADVTWEKDRWRTRCVEPGDARQASLIASVQAAQDAGAHIMVLPEFTLDLDHRRALARLLRSAAPGSLALVVAGSFHEPVGETAFNTAPLYAANGRAVLTHRKLRVFGSPDQGAEDVSLGDSIQVLATPVGCMTVLICKDFMDADATVESLLTEVPVDWVLVPSFGDEKTIRAHKERAKALAVVKTGTSTVVAQTLNTAVPREGPPTECVRGFGHAAGRGKPEPQVGDAGGLVVFGLLPQPPASIGAGQRPALKRIK